MGEVAPEEVGEVTHCCIRTRSGDNLKRSIQLCNLRSLFYAFGHVTSRKFITLSALHIGG